MKVYIAEIAGKDSVAAVHKFVRENAVDRIIPTIVYTGTEYGDRSSYYASIEYLKEFLHRSGVTVGETIELHDEKLWNYLCIRFQNQIFQKYGFYTPCVMCHLFAHLLRVPVLAENQALGIITGERFQHEKRQKANQHQVTIKCFNRLFTDNRISLVQPLLEIADTGVIDQEIGDYKEIGHINDVKCILSGNLNGVSLEEEAFLNQLSNYVDEFIYPIGSYLLQRFLDGDPIEYEILDEIVGRCFDGR